MTNLDFVLSFCTLSFYWKHKHGLIRMTCPDFDKPLSMNATCVPPSFILSGKYFHFDHSHVSLNNENKYFEAWYPSLHKIAITMRFMHWQGSKIIFTLFQQCISTTANVLYEANLICFYCDNILPFFACFKLRYFPLIPLLSQHYVTGRWENENKTENKSAYCTRMSM